MEENEAMLLQLTPKGLSLSKQISLAFDEWLKASGLTKETLVSKYKNVQGFHIVNADEGFYMAYYEKGKEKQIGMGLYKEQKDMVIWIFGRACSYLDNGSNYKSSFSREIMKWGEANER